MNTDYDFVAIGDVVIDAFIRLKDASVTCDVDKTACKLSVAFGDKVPYEFVHVVTAVGNSPNAAVSAQRLGLKSALVTNVGGDQHGKECIEELKKNGIHIDFVTTHPDQVTNYHYVLWYEDERTILVKHQEYKYSFPNIGNPKWAYVSSLAQNSLSYHEEMMDYFDAHPDIKIAFQPGTFQMKLGFQKLERLYKRSEIFFCNVEEAKRILGIEETLPVEDLLKKMRDLGPNIVVITDGPRGAYCYDGNEGWFMPPYPDPKPPYERTGAGDSFASTFTAALALGHTITDALMWGPINSMSVVQYIGAQEGLLTKDDLLAHLKNAPQEFQPKKII